MSGVEEPVVDPAVEAVEAEEAPQTSGGGGGGSGGGAYGNEEEEELDLDLDLDLGKKKKKKKVSKKKKVVAAGSVDPEAAAAAAAAAAEVDPEAAAELASEDPEAAAEAMAAMDLDGGEAMVFEEDVVPWAGSDRDYNYTELMDRVFKLLREKNPALSTRKKHTMPPPQLVRVGTRKTMWTNYNQICQTMHRNPEHFTSFLLAELGTEGSIDGSKRLIFKGRFVPKQIESLLKKYIVEYVTCHMCRNPETTLTRDQVTRLFFLQCESCGSRRSVAPVRAGYHATSRSDRRKAKMAAG